MLFCDSLRYLYHLKLINYEKTSSIDFIFAKIKSIEKKKSLKFSTMLNKKTTKLKFTLSNSSRCTK